MSPAVDDLAAWITQIWDEQEAEAREWQRKLDDDIAIPACMLGGIRVPVEILARIAADRQILALATKTIADAPVRGYDWDSEYVLAQAVAYEQVIRLLALPYADRPGYQEAWKPE